MPFQRNLRPIRGPATCEAIHHLTVDDLQRSLKAELVSDQCCDWSMSDQNWVALAEKFAFPTKTAGDVEARTLVTHLIAHHRYLITQRILRLRSNGKVPQRAKQRQLRVLARPSKRPVRMPATLYPDVVSLLAFRLAVYGNRLSDVGKSIEDFSTEIRSLSHVTPEVRRAAWEVHILGAFRREDRLIGKKNVDMPVRLLISCCANFWRFGLGRVITFWQGDSRKRQHADGEPAYSEFITFVHTMLHLAGAPMDISRLFKRIEDALNEMFANETCEYGCGFNILQRDLNTAGNRQVFQEMSVQDEVPRAGGVLIPEFTLTRRGDSDAPSGVA